MSTFKDMQDEHAVKMAVLRERVGACVPPVRPRTTLPRPSRIDHRPTQSRGSLSLSFQHRDIEGRGAHFRQRSDGAGGGRGERRVEVFENQKRVEEQARELRRKGAKFAGVTSEWVRIVRGFDDDLREIGDFEGWIKRVEFDLNNLTEAMKKVAEQGTGDAPEG
jgi:hypothetical protein